jgi:DNA replication protein DnaC
MSETVAQNARAESEQWAKEINEAAVKHQLENWRRPRLDVIPRRYRNAVLERDEIRAWLGQMLDGEEGSLCLIGPTGTGKTYTMWGIYRALVDAQMDAIAINLIEFLDRLRPGGEDESQTLKRLVGAPVLMMDDLGMHKGSEWADERLYLILNARYEAMRPSVFTTNYPVAKWVEVLGARIASRLIEDCRVVEMRGKDRRVP